MEDMAASSERRLRQAGIRMTAQRKLVLDILARASSHLNASEIYERGQRQDARPSLATVYRTLNLFKNRGVVRELHLNEKHHHYELRSKGDHSHLVCRKCGRVIEVDSAPLVAAAIATGEAYGFEIASAHVELAGYCADCRQ